MGTIVISVDSNRLAKGIIADIKKAIRSRKSRHMPNQSHGKAI